MKIFKFHFFFLNAPAGIRTRVNWLEASYTATILPTHTTNFELLLNKVFVNKALTPKEGFEPSTSSLGGKHSIQTELLGQGKV